ncbi:hypothetical protein F0562_003144 [Nyssa sinensis]|uniref:PB1 domain-containing protein n=1 Tax=Nyssa sinensis TaxID=561372 RepID=A0A5J5BUP6_9ASTE|nr:hypothetical protein F0562_003144 [Nyssa sinensis]
MKGCSPEVRYDEMINLSADGKEIVECDAINNGGKVGGEGPSLTAITLSKKNKRKMSKRKYNTDKPIGLGDLEQCYGLKRTVAANNLGVSVSTFKRLCRRNGIFHWSHKINKDKQSLSTSTRKGVTKSVLRAEGSHNPTSLSPKLLPGAVGTVSWPSSLNGSHRGYIQGSKPPELRGKNNESFSYMTPENDGILIENAGSSKNVSNFFPSAAEADLEGWISESVMTDLPCSDPASKQPMATLSRPMPHVGAKQDMRIVTFKAEWKMPHGKAKIIRFKMSSTSGIDELKEEVTKRLMLEASTFSIEYRDDEGEWISLTCDADLQELQDSMNISSSSGKNIIRLRVQDEIDNSRNSSKSCR